jgi:hypothetical protein
MLTSPKTATSGLANDIHLRRCGYVTDTLEEFAKGDVESTGNMTRDELINFAHINYSRAR